MTTATANPPEQEYASRKSEREQQVSHLEQSHIRLGNLRLLLAVVAVGTAWLSLQRHLFSIIWIAVPVAAFVLIAVVHARVLRRQELALRAARFYQRGLDRISDRWAGTNPRDNLPDALHSLYAADLDLFGDASLFELLCTTRTRMGEDTLADWLLTPAILPEILERQAAIDELRGRLDLREAIAIQGRDAAIALHPKSLVKWAEKRSRVAPPLLRSIALLLAICTVVAGVFWIRTGMISPFAALVLIEWCLNFPLRRRVQEALGGTDRALQDMRLVADLLLRLETEPFESVLLRRKQQELSATGIASSAAIGKLSKLVATVEMLHNPFARIFDVPLMFSVQLAFAVRRWRDQHGESVRRWLQALGEVEALLAISAYAFEHPQDPFPEFVPGKPFFHAEGLGHPLLPAAKCVRNDTHVDGETPLILVSGSNMSGKSTLLRSIGINTVLAMCGAPVRARRLQLTPLTVAASILVSDSLNEGSSRFYAEITRLRAICDLAEQRPPVLFLLDELLQGTNSKDRLIGAEGIAHALVASGAIGVISTHDLSLTEFAGADKIGLRNMHLQDNIEDGKMSFDFLLRDGVVTRSNGVELMRLVGLKV